MRRSDADQHAIPGPRTGGRGLSNIIADNGSALAIFIDQYTLPALVLDVAGEMDAVTAPRLLAALRVRLDYPILVVDLSGLEFHRLGRTRRASAGTAAD